MKKALENSKKALVLAVGGGNDSVSALMLLAQLRRDCGFAPEATDILGMLPDCLDYEGLEPTGVEGVERVAPGSSRSVGGKRMEGFVEALLAAGIEDGSVAARRALGMRMDRGSRGMAAALAEWVEKEGYDLVLAVDVGGDFIAVPENGEVLSPMMDGYALSALRDLAAGGTKAKLVGAVFGLGTDGESSPEMLDLALRRLEGVRGNFDAGTIEEAGKFYRGRVEPVRYSRTADFVLREADGAGHENPAQFRARFHAGPGGGETFYGNFERRHDEGLYGGYWLFEDFGKVGNPFALECSSGLEWLAKVWGGDSRKINHELCGQGYKDVGRALGDGRFAGKSFFCATPSSRFAGEGRRRIVELCMESAASGEWDAGAFYAEDLPEAAELGRRGLAAFKLPGQAALAVRSADVEWGLALAERLNELGGEGGTSGH